MNMLDAALDLAAQGWAVFPCRWHGDRAKSPLTEHGQHDAVLEPDVIRSWWARWPYAMIGAPVPESLAVIDVDPRNGGALDDLTALVGPVPTTLTVWSGRSDGGRHLYFQRPFGTLSSTRLPAGIDLKVRGYCIVPPSLHPATGHPYVWEERPVAAMSAGMRDLLRPKVAPRAFQPTKGGNGDGLIRWVEGLEINNRNDGLYWAARKAAEEGLLTEIAENLVQAAISSGLPETEARRTVASAARAGGAW